MKAKNSNEAMNQFIRGQAGRVVHQAEPGQQPRARGNAGAGTGGSWKAWPVTMNDWIRKVTGR